MKKIFFFMLKRTLKCLHYINTLSMFLFFSWTWCLTEIVSRRSNTYSCWSLSDDRHLFAALVWESQKRLSIKTCHRYHQLASPYISLSWSNSLDSILTILNSKGNMAQCNSLVDVIRDDYHTFTRRVARQG